MTIIVRRRTGEAFEVVSGAHRLKAALHMFGKVEVTEAETSESFEVHQVDGQIVVLSRPGEAAAELATAKAIKRASQR